ncbi:LANO_0F12860g1_1 [Lachancea nothofagi CBS 11611]|uniref:Small ribosomal subunit protein uS10m n=1 Tax=Lachancea nothofagi CBS 11611 TaxID=1266666 RepID=A0A1G4KBG4_9SACH|nr:LANO_0F12860g1_1 [Lachancea nothofagi CBS 11611]
MIRNTLLPQLRSLVRFQSTSSIPEAASGPRKLPINVEAVYHAPLKIPITHGDLIADVQLRSYDHENLDFFSDFMLRAGFYLGMPLTGPKPLPTRRERWTVIRSPFAQAKSKENFERHTHKRLIRVWDTNPEVLELWLSYISKHSIPGVGIKCNLHQKEGIKLQQTLKQSSLLAETHKSQSLDEAVGEKVLELLNNEAFTKHM